MLRSRHLAACSVILLGTLLLQGQQPPAEPTVATSFKGHTGEVYSVAYSPDGKFLVTASFDRTLKIWDAATGKEIKTFGGTNGHQNLVLSMALSPDGTLIASGSSDNTARIWDFPTSTAIKSLPHEGAVTATAVSVDGTKYASADKTGAVRIVNVADGKELFKLKGHDGAVTGLSFSNNNQVLVSSGADRTVRFWNVTTGLPITVIGAHTAAVNGVAFALNSNSSAYSIGDDGQLKFWQMPQNPAKALTTPHTDRVTAISLSSDGNAIVSAGADKVVRISSLNSGQQKQLSGAASTILCTAAAPSGTLLAAGTDKDLVYLWNPADGKIVHQFPAHQGAVTEVAFTADSKQLWTAGQDGQVRLWSVPPVPAKTFTHPQAALAVSLSSDGKRLFTGSSDGMVRSWTVATNQVERQYQGHALAVTAVGVNPSGELIASAGGDRTIRLWNRQKGDLAALVGGHNDGINSLSFHPSNPQLVSGSTDGTVKLWTLPTTGAVALNHTDVVTCLALTPDGNKLISGCADKQVRVWNLTSGQSERSLDGNTMSVLCVAVSANGAQVAAGGADKSLSIWTLGDGKVVKRYTGLPTAVQAVAFAPDGKVLAGLGDNSLRLYDLTSKEVKEIKTLAGHTGPITALTLTPKGDLFVSGSADKSVKLWKVADGSVATSLDLGSPVQAVAVNKAGSKIAAAGDKTVKVWGIDGKLLHTITLPIEVRGVAFHPDDAQLVVGAADNKARLLGLDGVLREFFAHEGEVTAVALSPDGKRVISAGKDKTARVWRPSFTWLGQHTGTVTQAAFTPRGDQVVSVGQDKTIKVWNAADGKLIVSKDAHPDTIVGLSFNTDGSRLATASVDGAVKVWALTPGDKMPLAAPPAEIKADGKVQAVALSADGSRVAVALEEASKQNVLAVFDVTSRKELLRVRGEHTAALAALTFARDNRTLLTASADKNVKFIDVPVLAALEAHVGGVTRMALRSNGTALLTGGADKQVKLWELPTGKLLKTVGEFTEPISALRFSSDGTLAVAAAGKTVKTWTLADGKETLALTHPARVNGVSYNSDKTRLATACDDKWVRIWDVATGKEVEAFLHDGPVNAVLFRDATTLLSGGDDKTVWQNALRAGRAVPLSTETLTGMAVAANGTHVLVTGADKKIRVVNVSNGTVERTIEGLAEKATALALTKNGNTIAVATSEPQITLLNFSDGKLIGTIKPAGVVTSLTFNPANTALAATCASNAIQTWNVVYQPGSTLPPEFATPIQGYTHEGAALCLAFSLDGGTIYSGSEDKTLKVWKFASDKETKNFQHPNVVHTVAFNPAGTLLATACQDGQLRIFDVAKVGQPKVIAAHTQPTPEPIYCLAWSADGKQIATGSNDQTLKVWDATSGTLVRTFKAYKEKEFEKGHRDSVYSVAFSPDGKTLVSGSSDRTVKLWNLADGNVIKTLEHPKLSTNPQDPISHPGYVYGIRYSKDRKYLLTVGRANNNRGAVQIWTADGKFVRADEMDVGPIFGLTVAPDGKSVAIGTAPKGRPGTPEADNSPLAYILKLPTLP